jgi:hypothetical protein
VAYEPPTKETNMIAKEIKEKVLRTAAAYFGLKESRK